MNSSSATPGTLPPSAGSKAGQWYDVQEIHHRAVARPVRQVAEGPADDEAERRRCDSAPASAAAAAQP